MVNSSVERPGVDREYTHLEKLALGRLEILPPSIKSESFSSTRREPDLDDIIVAFLRDYANVDLTPSSSDAMTGAGTQMVNDIIGTGQIAARQYSGRNQKIAAKSLEWLHWKQWALNSDKFEDYKKEQLEAVRLQQESEESALYESRIKIADFLLSPEGQALVAYEAFPGRTAALIILLIPAVLLLFVHSVPFANDMPGVVAMFLYLILLIILNVVVGMAKGLSLREFLLRKLFKKPNLNTGILRYTGPLMDRQKIVKKYIFG